MEQAWKACTRSNHWGFPPFGSGRIPMRVPMGPPRPSAGSGSTNRRQHPLFPEFPPKPSCVCSTAASSIIGNSSAAIRECAFLGVPAVNLGTRQEGRERGRNVLDAPHDRQEICLAVKAQLAHGRFATDPVYGDGRAGERIAELLARVPLSVEKRLAY